LETADGDVWIAAETLAARLKKGESFEAVLTNAAGSDQTTVNILRGEPGPQGPAGSGGVDIVAVGGYLASQRHIYVNGIDQVNSGTAGTFVVLLDAATGAVTHAANYTDGAALTTTLVSAPAHSVVALVTGAPFLAPLLDFVGDSPINAYGSSLFGGQLTMGAQNGYALIGQNGMGPGAGFDTFGGVVTVAAQLLTGETAGAGALAGTGGRGVTNQMRGAFLSKDGDTVNGDLDVLGNLTVSGYPVFRDWGVASGSCSSCNQITATCPTGMKAIAGGCELNGAVNGSTLLISRPVNNGELFNAWTCGYTVSASDTTYGAFATCARVQ
jgi:hypothetical protein